MTGPDVCVCVCVFEKESVNDNVHVLYNDITLYIVSPPPDLQQPVGISWGHCASFISTNEPLEQVRPWSRLCLCLSGIRSTLSGPEPTPLQQPEATVWKAGLYTAGLFPLSLSPLFPLISLGLSLPFSFSHSLSSRLGLPGV